MSNLEHFPFLFPSEWPASDRQDSQKSETFNPPNIEATQLPSNTSLHDFFPDEILARIFSFMVWSWAWSGVCRKWHQIIRVNDWAKLAIPASKRDFRLYPCIQGLLSNMRSLVIKGFKDTTSFSLAAQFSELITLELRGALDYRHPDVPVTELREQVAMLPTYPNTFLPTLQHLHLHYLSVKTLTRIQLWAAEQTSPFASLTHLQLSLMISEEIQSLLPDPHPESVHQRFQACATIVNFHEPFYHPYDGNSSTTEPSDEASDAGSAKSSDARSDKSSDAGSAEASPAEGSEKGSDSTAASDHVNQSSPATELDEVALPSAPLTQPLGWDLAPEIVSGWDLNAHEVVEANLGWAAAGTNLSGGNPPEPALELGQSP
ncbi:hypothetical protein C8J56DRAFT_896450 [Mycena floridula]|nr:hypothetical protein C8J56DRAFT_896450 [Mycena floridula]